MINEVYLARYTDHMYPEDNEVFAAYATREQAQNRIEEECEWKKLRYSKDAHYTKIRYYSVEAVELLGT